MSERGDKARPAIDWARLLKEFESFRADEESCLIDCKCFTDSLIHPPPEFVESFLSRKIAENLSREEAVRDLYCFLLQKRYEERLNLLHFAFNIFDDDTGLPKSIVDRTPFPHEDGIPAFKHFGRSDFSLKPGSCR